jgi:hypothetical protein
MRRHAAAVVLATLAACSAYHSDSPPAMGAQGGTCYPNGTCNAGLVCASDICSPTNGTPPSGDGGDASAGPDGSGDAGGDSAKVCDPSPPPAVTSLPCGATQCSAATPVCCGSTLENLSCYAKGDAACATAPLYFECLSSAQCSEPAAFCCATIQVETEPHCPEQIFMQRSVCSSDPACGSDTRLCDADGNGCPDAKSCRGVDAIVPSASVTAPVGACL